MKKIVKSEKPNDPDILLVEFKGYKGKNIVADKLGNIYENVIPVSM